MNHAVKVNDATSGYFGTEGQVERIYWREEVPWVRIRSREGLCLSVPSDQTDLPTLIAPSRIQTPLLSPQVLVELMRHLKQRGKRSSKLSKKRTSC